jgi:hypothetical protein
MGLGPEDERTYWKLCLLGAHTVTSISTQTEQGPGPRQRIRRARLATQLDVSVRTLDNWVKAKILPAPMKIGRCWFFDLAAVEDALKANQPVRQPA